MTVPDDWSGDGMVNRAQTLFAAGNETLVDAGAFQTMMRLNDFRVYLLVVR